MPETKCYTVYRMVLQPGQPLTPGWWIIGRDGCAHSLHGLTGQLIYDTLTLEEGLTLVHYDPSGVSQ